MSDNDSDDDDVAMLVCNDTLSDMDDDQHDDEDLGATTKTIAPPVSTGTIPYGRAAGKELRRKLKHKHDDDTSDDDDDDDDVVEAHATDDDDDDDDVMAAVVLDDDDGDDAIPVGHVVQESTKWKKTKSKKSREGPRVSPDRLAAASDARIMLVQAIPRLPVAISDSHVVRSFGRIYVESKLDSKFSSASALYPVGFSCDRYEFSPVHGRVLKMRCTIFDGKRIKEKQRKHGETSSLPDGPVFRVMWGPGIDEDTDIIDYPYDVYGASAPITNDDNVDTVALPVTGKEGLLNVEPGEGMRIKVRYDHDEWYTGTITSVGKGEYDRKKKRNTYEISILYDDGAIEDTVFPDPDISIHLPGSEDEANENGVNDLKELHGKPVTSVIGSSPLEAWGKALVKLGLIDEIMLEMAFDAVAAARIEGREEAKEKLHAQKLQRQQARVRSLQRQAGTEQDDDDETKEDTSKAEDAASSKAVSPVPSSVLENEEDDTGETKLPQEETEPPKEDDSVAPAAAVDKQEEAQASQAEAGKSDYTPHREEGPKGNDADMQDVTPVPSSVIDNEEDAKTETNQKENGEPEKTEEDAGKACSARSEEVKEEVEPPSEAEIALRAEVDKLEQELAELQSEDQEAIIALSDARIGVMGPLLVNPFYESGPSSQQQSSWLATVVRKEKAKMGSTGNKKKIVTATDLLERNDTFFDADIEALVEGLPGSEYCPSYVFRAFRAGGASAVSQAWIHEAKLRQERDREKQLKSDSEAKVKASQLLERELKRKLREEERDARKRQKIEEAEEKKRARAEERMSRLNVQVDERLFKEACFQREKVVLLIAKSLGKEFANRRKAAELVSSQAVLDGWSKNRDHPDELLAQELPPLSRLYDEDVLRVWDFFITFGSSFLEWGYLTSIPSLDSLQDAIDTLRDETRTQKSRSEAIDLLVKHAIALCQPLAASLTKLLFASLIALNPALQKDFGAAFFAEVNASTNANDESGDSSSTSLLPVNKMTWQEIARLAFLSDALGEIGFSRQESAHLLRGYRSGGHPNSKEAKRLRRAEEFSTAVLRQQLLQRAFGMSSGLDEVASDYKIRIHVPCKPSTSRGTWIFYLHNVKSLQPGALKATMKNIGNAMALLETAMPKPTDAESFSSDLKRALSMLEKIDSTEELSPSDIQTCEKARRLVLRVLDRATGETYSRDKIGQIINKEPPQATETEESIASENQTTTAKLKRQRIGLLKNLALTAKDYKHLVHKREEYMAEALRLKEELNQNEGEEDEDDEDDDDDGNEQDDNDAGDPAKKGTEVTGGKQPCSPNALQPDEEKENEATSEIVATVIENGDDNAEIEALPELGKTGKTTPYDDFCGDVPGAPDVLRRCLAVLRTLCLSGPAEPFLFPIDPQTNPGYYENILKPMCLREVGIRLREAALLYSRDFPSGTDISIPHIGENDMVEEEVESVVAQFARNVRLISQNCACYTNAGPAVVSAGEEMTRIFERLLLDWVLAPKSDLPPLALLDDDRCVEHHTTDEDSLVLLCDGCEGKYNMSRLDPPLLEVPKGDWFCPRCLSGRCWESLDPRIGKKVRSTDSDAVDDKFDPQEDKSCCGTIRRCLLGRSEGAQKAYLLYDIEFGDGSIETWTLSEVDKALADSGQHVEPVHCIEAVAESPGYGLGTDRGVFSDLVPVMLNPCVSDSAAQAAVSSSVFRDTIAGSSALRLISPEEMTADEWLRLLVLLITKCSSSEIMQAQASKMEAAAAEEMAKQLQENIGKIGHVCDVLPSISDDEDDSHSDGRKIDEQTAVAVEESRDDTQGEEAVKSVKAESVVEVDSSAVVVDASAIEVVTDMEVEPVVVAETTTSSTIAGQDKVQPKEEKSKRSVALADKEKRQKAREDSIAAYCIKNELRPTVASFEEDVVSQVVDSTLSTKDRGLNLSSCRYRGKVCDFCGLSDVALGLPLVRAPTSSEWNELMPHAARLRRTLLIAELGKNKRLATVTIRVAGEIVSEEAEGHFFDEIEDGGMTEFLPKNESGFQDELSFRDQACLPFISGSLSAHECCAIAAHKTRKERIVEEYKEKESMLVEWSAGKSCGRSQALGKDKIGRSYWKLNADSSLFVCMNDAVGSTSQWTPKSWLRFAEPEVIASLMYCLGKDPVLVELKRAFPSAARMVKNGKWSELLLKRRFPLNRKTMLTAQAPESTSGKAPKQKISAEEVADDDDVPYEEEEDVLVESKCGKLLWNAKVVGVSHAKDSYKVNSYRVHYKDWSSRYDEWVDPFRVVEPSENNNEVQAEMLEEVAAIRDSIPTSLEKMAAKDFYNAKDRARGSVVVPNLVDVAKVEPSASSDEITFGLLKAALLLVEASLPIGAIDNSDEGPWSSSFASEWRSSVQSARGPSSLAKCVLLLEDALSPEWMESQFSHLLSCMPIRWKAIKEASVSSLALRIFLIDQGLHYGDVDKQKFGSSSKGSK